MFMHQVKIVIDNFIFFLDIEKQTIARKGILDYFYFYEVESDKIDCGDVVHENFHLQNELNNYPYKPALDKFKKLKAFL
jgi:hypothetical protein